MLGPCHLRQAPSPRSFHLPAGSSVTPVWALGTGLAVRLALGCAPPAASPGLDLLGLGAIRSTGVVGSGLGLPPWRVRAVAVAAAFADHARLPWESCSEVSQSESLRQWQNTAQFRFSITDDGLPPMEFQISCVLLQSGTAAAHHFRQSFQFSMALAGPALFQVKRPVARNCSAVADRASPWALIVRRSPAGGRRLDVAVAGFRRPMRSQSSARRRPASAAWPGRRGQVIRRPPAAGVSAAAQPHLPPRHSSRIAFGSTLSVRPRWWSTADQQGLPGRQAIEPCWAAAAMWLRRLRSTASTAWGNSPRQRQSRYKVTGISGVEPKGPRDTSQLSMVI